MVDRRLFKVSNTVVNYAQINVGQELARNISHFLVLHMEVDRLFVEGWLCLAQLHIVHSDAVVS